MGIPLDKLLSGPNRDKILKLNPQLLQKPQIDAVAQAQERAFTIPGKPIGKPRQTQRDKWQKRPSVLAYRAYADAARLAAGPLPPGPDSIEVKAFIPMPESWSQKKKEELNGSPCRSKPDADNIAKSVFDALFEQDAGIWHAVIEKRWCRQGDERTEVRVLYSRT